MNCLTMCNPTLKKKETQDSLLFIPRKRKDICLFLDRTQIANSNCCDDNRYAKRTYFFFIAMQPCTVVIEVFFLDALFGVFKLLE